jgi:hypothetical protein
METLLLFLSDDADTFCCGCSSTTYLGGPSKQWSIVAGVLKEELPVAQFHKYRIHATIHQQKTATQHGQSQKNL